MFIQKNLQLIRPRPHYAGINWKPFLTLKTHQMFSVHTTPEKYKNATIESHFGFVFEENTGRQITWLSWRHRFRKAPFSKRFPSPLKSKVSVFKFLQFEDRFRKKKNRFSWRISVDGRPNRRNKAAFSNFSGVVSVDGALIFQPFTGNYQAH